MIDEVDNFLFRPHLGLRSKYHAVCSHWFSPWFTVNSADMLRLWWKFDLAVHCTVPAAVGNKYAKWKLLMTDNKGSKGDVRRNEMKELADTCLAA